MDTSKGRQQRILVMASSALDRRALSAGLPRVPGLELVGICASPSATRDKLLRERVDVVFLDASSSEAVQKELQAVALDRGVRAVCFDPAPIPDETRYRLLEALAESPKTKADRPARTREPVMLSVVAIGSSTGGPDALGELIPHLPKSFSAAVLVAQHMPKTFTPILAMRLAQRSQLAIHEAESGEALRPGTVLIAPGDHHLEVTEDGKHVRLHRGPPENSCRPAVDVLFRSLASALGHRALGVVLTGMGRDGLEGARALRTKGAEVVVQDERSSVVWGMPGLIAREGLASQILPLIEIAPWLVERIRRDGGVLNFPSKTEDARNP